MKLDLGHNRTFQENVIPANAQLVGWAALVQALSIKAPLRHPSCVSEKQLRGSRREEGVWTIFERRYWPGDAFQDHFAFALRHEPIDLLVLQLLFEAVNPEVIATYVREA